MKKNITISHAVIYLILLLLFFIFIFTGSFSYLQDSISDNLYGGKNTLNNIVIINIDDESINNIGRWPWNRNVFAELLNKTQKAKVIGIDVSFFEPSDNDFLLNSTLQKMDNLVLAAEINQKVLYKPIFNTNYGYVNLITDSDGVTRKFHSSLQEEINPFAIEVFNRYNPNKNLESKEYIINYANIPGSFESYPAYEVLNSNANFSNKIVLIGATAPNLHDNYFVPTSQGIAMPGVEIHANILQNLILNDFLEKQEKINVLLLVILISILCFFILSRMKIYYSLPLIIFIVFIYFFLSILMFNKFNLILDMLYIPLCFFIFLGGGIAVNYLEEKKRTDFLKTAFSKYVNKNLLGELMNKKHQLKLGGDKRELTIFFSDIRSFTSISEKLSATKLVDLLNNYLTSMTKIILKHQGTVDKFIGDAVMALWNAPLKQKDHALLCCQSAIEQIKELEKLKKSYKEQKLPQLKIGCGIHTGEAIVGNMGSEDRFDYTAIGDNINLASRLEGLTKQYGVEIIISSTTHEKIKNKLKCRKLDKVKVKGKKIPITIYELLTNTTKKDLEFAKQYEKALELYFNKKFKLAKKEFEKTLKLNKKDLSTKTMIQRCKEFIKKSPKKDWDGSFESKTK